jgi:hypothetical protein
MVISTISHALQDHLVGCRRYLSVTERYRLTELLKSYSREVQHSRSSQSTRSFDWYSFIFTDCSFFLNPRVPLAELDPSRVLSANILPQQENLSELLLPQNERSYTNDENQDPESEQQLQVHW